MEAATVDLKRTRVFLCLDCGKCTAVCPISRYNSSYSPRRLVANGVQYGTGSLLADKLIWSCLTCQLCSKRCPVDVDYSGYMRDIRAEASARGESGNPSHGGALHHIMEMTACPELKQNRTGWISDDLKIKKKGELLYFVGCLPYYQEMFGKEFKFSPQSIACDTVKVLNYLGFEPVVLENERCCGHDLYWLGKLDKFDELARLNLEAIKASGAKTVVTSCPECALALKQLYSERLGSGNFQVKHISQLIAESIDKLKFKNLSLDIAFQDPCRLGRYLGIYDEPRAALTAIPGVRLHEMAHSKRGAVCCGTTNWMNCDSTSKQIQQSRLNEAKAVGAQTLVTACPKCQIHFRCTQCGEQAEKVDLEVTDLVNIVASALME